MKKIKQILAIQIMIISMTALSSDRFIHLEKNFQEGISEEMTKIMGQKSYIKDYAKCISDGVFSIVNAQCSTDDCAANLAQIILRLPKMQSVREMCLKKVGASI